MNSFVVRIFVTSCENRPLGQVSVYNLATWWGIREGKMRRDFLRPTPYPSLLRDYRPLGKTFFLSPVFHCMKIQDGG